MVTVNALQRVFLCSINGQPVELADPSAAMPPANVLRFYANTYPELTNAKLEGPFPRNDRFEYQFATIMGTKG